MVKEWFQYRNDMLKQREVDHMDKVTVERFSHGRRFHLQRESSSRQVTIQGPLPVSSLDPFPTAAPFVSQSTGSLTRSVSPSSAAPAWTIWYGGWSSPAR